MHTNVALAPPDEVRTLRDLYRKEMSCQIIHDSWHARGWTDSYLLRCDGAVVGYALVGGIAANPRDIITEFYVLPVHRGVALPLFRELAAVSQTKTVEAQTNDVLLTLMLYDCAVKIESDRILFHDAFATSLSVPGTMFRRVAEPDRGRIFAHKVEPVGDWLIEADGQVAATGGLLFHYNPPYGDIHMEVAEPLRRRGFGSFLVQELKRACYDLGKIPAARCNASNVASRATLQLAGMLPCARLLTGTLGPLASQPLRHRDGST